MENFVYIYSLEYPLGNVRYIGKTKNLAQRLQKHIREARKSTKNHRLSWINSLLKIGEKPIMNEVDFVDENDWQIWEMFYISLYKSWGFALTNSTFGGEGLLANENVRRKISESCKKHWETNEVWAKRVKGTGLLKGRTSFSDKEIENNTRVLNNYVKEHGVWNKDKSCRVPDPTHRGRNFSDSSKKVIQLSLDGSFIKEWESASCAGHSLGLGPIQIRQCLKGDRKSAFGYLWIRKGDYGKKD